LELLELEKKSCPEKARKARKTKKKTVRGLFLSRTLAETIFKKPNKFNARKHRAVQ
jgi:hypothetical protein